MGISKGSAQWNGGLKDGSGSMKPAHAPEAKYSLGSRLEGQPGSSPEELIGAGLAGCFAMALTLALEKNGNKPVEIKSEAAVRLEQKEGAFTITQIALSTEAKVPSLADADFQKIAEETKRTCPVSRALAGTEIKLTAKLASA